MGSIDLGLGSRDPIAQSSSRRTAITIKVFSTLESYLLSFPQKIPCMFGSSWYSSFTGSKPAPLTHLNPPENVNPRLLPSSSAQVTPMLAPSAEAAVRFDSASRIAPNDPSIPIGGTPRALREAAEAAGLDPLPQLYNEALRYATEGHLRLARERLQMLVCMAPDDGEARLLLAKVFVAGQRWQDALSALDEAQNCGQSVPLELRETIEHHVRTQNLDSDEQRASLLARERGEIKALRAEARRLRSETAQMTTTVYELEKETRKWAWATAGVSTVAIVFILANLLFGGSPKSTVTVETNEPPATEATVASAGSAAAASEATPAAIDDQSVAGRAAAALADAKELDGTQLEVVIDSGKAKLVGQVISARQRRTAKRILSQVEGITEVGTDQVEILARTRGTVHTVGRGETLSHISARYYGTVTLARQIRKANPGSKTLHIGDKLKIPSVD